MPRFLLVEGVPGCPVTNPHASAPVYVATDKTRTTVRRQVILDHADLRKAIAKRQLVLHCEATTSTIDEALELFADDLEQ